MRFTKTFPLLIVITATSLFFGCASNSDSTEDFRSPLNSEAKTKTANFSSGTPILVHVDDFERIVTVRNGLSLGGRFLVVKNRAGKETAVLKGRPHRGIGALLTADVLEGSPKVGNAVFTASSSRSSELEKIYGDPIAEIQ